nr:hypothetical protein [uncultured Cohaesibacter sp.]
MSILIVAVSKGVGESLIQIVGEQDMGIGRGGKPPLMKASRPCCLTGLSDFLADYRHFLSSAYIDLDLILIWVISEFIGRERF